jgi:hypothetical protein
MGGGRKPEGLPSASSFFIRAEDRREKRVFVRFLLIIRIIFLPPNLVEVAK